MFVELGESEKKIPEAVEFYNKIKCAVDVADQMVSQYSVKTGTRRWPVAIFYNILDLAGINAFVLYKKRTGGKVQNEISCSSLLQDYVKTILLKGSSRNSTIARPHSLSTAHKKPKPRT